MTPLRVKQSILANASSSPGGSTNYNDLTNKPKINNVELTGNKTAEELGISGNVQADWNTSDPTAGSYINNKPTIPTNTSDLTNDGDGRLPGSIDGYALTNEPGNGISVVRDSTTRRLITKPIWEWTVGNELAYVSDVPTKTSDLVNDGPTSSWADFYAITQTQDTGLDVSYVNGVHRVSPIYQGSIVTPYLANLDDLTTKQDTLVSGTNIKTINNQSLLGSGNINIQGLSLIHI